MVDKYLMINTRCCNNPKLQLIWEPSLGYEPFVYCINCNGPQHFPRLDPNSMKVILDGEEE